jgi:hypothetical protein
MRNRRWIWIVAIVVTIGSAVFQRMTGPTYPVRGHVTLGSQEYKVSLTRTHGGPGVQPVRLVIPDPAVEGEVAWRRYPTEDAWASLPLTRNGDALETALPHQPVAGKLEYQVRLRRGDERAVFPARPAITRFRNDVPNYVLIPHVAAMFFAMLFSTAAGLSALGRWPHARRESYIGTVLIVIGGFVLGPLMQKIAFGAWWTGIPLGWDLTDNKTLFAALAWIWAVWQLRGGREARITVIAASVLTLVIFAIPHSTWGSEHKWDAGPPTAQTP